MTTSDGSICRMANNHPNLSWTIPRSAWPIQLVLYSGMAGVVVYLFSALPNGVLRPLALNSPLFELLPSIIVFSIACYTWVRFKSTTSAYWLAACLAFLGYTGFTTCHVALDVVAGSQGPTKLASEWLVPLSRITLAAFLIAAATTRRRLPSARSSRVGANFCVAWLTAMSLSVIGLVKLAEYVYPSIASGNETAILLGQIAPYSAATIACVIATSIMATAALREGDAAARLACIWLLPTTVSCGVRVVYSLNLDVSLLWQARTLDVAAAALAAIALNIHSARDHGRANEQLHDLRAMHDISWSLAAAANLTAMLSEFVRVLTETAGAKLAALYLVNEAGDELQLEAVVGEGSEFLQIGSRYSLEPEARPGFHSGHTARALREQTSQAVEDVFSDVEFLQWRLVAQNDGWVVSVPLISRKTAIGVFNVHLVQQEHINKDRLHMLETMAALVAPAIESRRNSIQASHLEEQAKAA